MSQTLRKKGESFDAFLRRTKKSWQDSGRIFEVRKGQVFTGKRTKRARRQSALARIGKKARMEYLKNTGKMSKKDLETYRRAAK